MRFPDRRPFRKPSNWLAAVAIEALAPVLRTYARAKTSAPSPPRAWKRALITGASHIGDLLYRSASLEPLKAGLPDCEFHYLATPGSSEILESNPALTSILPWMRSDSSLDLSPSHFAELRAMRFDAMLCTNSGKYWPELLLALRLGIPNRAGYTYKGFSGWVTHPLAIEYPQPFPAYFRDYVASLTRQAPEWPLRPAIHANAVEEAAAAALWEALGLQAHASVVACFMTTRQPTGTWPSEKFGETLSALRRKRDAHIVLCGAVEDQPLLARVNNSFALGADIVAGKLGLRALFCFVRHCAVVFTTDSGPRHIANAAGVPVLFLRNVWSDPVETGAYLETETDLCGHQDQGDPRDGAALLDAIDPESVACKLAASF